MKRQKCHQSIVLFPKNEAGDAIFGCGDGIVDNLYKYPYAMMNLADKHLHVFPYKDVDYCWKRLYTDASLINAYPVLKDLCKSEVRSRIPEGVREVLIDDVVKLLDMAVLMAGACGRDNFIQDWYKQLALIPGIGRFVMPPTFPDTQLKRPLMAKSAETSTYNAVDPLPLGDSPVRLQGLQENWPTHLCKKWHNPGYFMLISLGGRRLVPIELGRSYAAQSFSQSIMPLRKFFSQYLLNSEAETIAYLAQHDLFSQLPDLESDIQIPSYCPSGLNLDLHPLARSMRCLPLKKIWIGPAGTISPLHTDSYHNILCQVVGAKYVRLYPPSETEKLYPRITANDGIDMSNTSTIDPEIVEMNIEEETDGGFPLFSSAQYIETILEEGESLYIPAGWWHYIRSLSVSISVSFWWK
ncbi:hypothetical protein MMC25_007514 [Agyrium rufum]|nr:hypothetical protein [Agyrium rufum]